MLLRLLQCGGLAAILGCQSVVMAGTIFVTSAADTDNSADPEITLREAILIANGTRQPFDSPVVGQPDEAGHVTGGFGSGTADTIQFQSGLGTIALTNYLPDLTDSGDTVRGSSDVPVSGAGLPVNENKFAFQLTIGNQTLTNLILQDFPGSAIRIVSANNTISNVVIKSPDTHGIVLSQPTCTGNTISSCEIDGATQDGIFVLSGASANRVFATTMTRCTGSGVLVTGLHTDNNVFFNLRVGITNAGEPAGNGAYGIEISDGAKGNRFGNPDDIQGAASLVSNNGLGGVMVQDLGTDNNLIHTMWLGYSTTVAEGVGNGTLGNGITVQRGAKNNSIGVYQGIVIIAGHKGDGVLVSDFGTEGNNLAHVFVGGINNTVPGFMSNKGHGIHIANGASNMRIGEDRELAQVEIDGSGPGKHGVFLDGSFLPVRGITFGYYHFGVVDGLPGGPRFGGDAIHVSGDVQNVTIGAASDHRNHTCSANGYGIRLDGPQVANIRLRRVHVGEHFGSSFPNTLGGILITNGAHDIQIGTAGELSRCYVSGNTGPGIIIDGRGEAPPYNIAIQDSWIGLGDDGNSTPNGEDGIIVDGLVGTSPQPLTGIDIGLPDVNFNRISGNTKNGIQLRNVSGIRIRNNRIGLSGTDAATRANVMNGILLNNCRDSFIGGESPVTSRNIISGNTLAGIRFTANSSAITVQNNFLGSDPTGVAERGGNFDGAVVIDSPGAPSGAQIVIGGQNEIAANLPDPKLAQGNLIAGNDGPGIVVKGARVAVRGNLIGTTATGLGKVSNGGSGILISGSAVQDVAVGSDTEPLFANVISGSKHGVEINDAGGWKIHGNAIGTDARRMASVANTQSGIDLKKARQGEIGSLTSDGARNVISGNLATGILIEDDTTGPSLVIAKNYIGTSGNGSAALGNRDGIVVRSASAPIGSQVTIGGRNIENTTPGKLGSGNLVSGNLRDGIRVESTGGAPPSLTVAVTGNVIGLDVDGKTTLPNQGVGIHAVAGIQALTIGHADDDTYGNIISGNTQEGVWLEGNATSVTIARNRIGCGADEMDELPNQGAGVRIDGGAHVNTVSRNRILYNGGEGVIVRGASATRNKITRNAIHRNIKKGIAIVDGANAGVKAPMLGHPFFPRRATNSISGKTNLPFGTVEFFTDPYFDGETTGQWGQGKFFQTSLQTSGSFSAGAEWQDRGFFTATITDGDGNTSEFSPLAGIRVIQAISPEAVDFTDDQPLLIENKTTVVRAYIDGGNDATIRTITGLAGIGMAPTIAPAPVAFKMREYAAYDSDAKSRGAALESMNFTIPMPPGGTQSITVTIQDPFQNERQTVTYDGYIFQSGLDSDNVAVVGARTPGVSGGPLNAPSLPHLIRAAQYFRGVYPVDPVIFSKNFYAIMGPFGTTTPNSSFGQKHALLTAGEASRVLGNTKGKSIRHLAVGIAQASGLDHPNPPPPGERQELFGFSLPNLRLQTSLVVDRIGNTPTGPLMAHEFGHTPPYRLGDTYEDPSYTTGRNPILTGSRAFRKGNRILEQDFAYNVEGTVNLSGNSSPGPAGSTSTTVHDFMGDSPTSAWVDPPTNRLLFKALNGNVPARGGALINAPLVIRGELDKDGGAQLIQAMRPTLPMPRDTDPDLVSDLVVELLDGGGGVLDSERVPDGPLFGEELGIADEDFGRRVTPDRGPFSVVLNDNPAATRVVIKRGAAELGSIAKSPASPTVSIASPLGGATVPGEKMTVSWNSSDVDGGSTISVDVLYTPDGTTRLPLATGLGATGSVDVSTDLLPSGTAPRIIVRASDGWNATEAQTDPPLIVSSRIPLLEITSPLDGSSVPTERAVALSAAAYDPEDGLMIGDAIEWAIDGSVTPFATGDSVSTEFLAGPHVITATARDEDGNAVVRSVTINAVSPEATLVEVLDRLLGRSFPERPDYDQSGDTIVDGADAARLAELNP